MSDHSVYSGLSGASAAWRQLEVVSNNVANLSTEGFRAARVAFATEVDGAWLSAQAAIATVSPTSGDGPLIDTGEAGHIALRGDGYLSVETGAGEQLTRDGRFRLDDDGMLVAPDGARLLGEGGPIALGPGEHFRIDPEGRVVGELSGEVGRLRLVRGPALHVGGNRWTAAGKLERAQPTVVQGALEGSNVDPARAMTELVEASRYFEVFQKAIQTSDDLAARLNQSGGM